MEIFDWNCYVIYYISVKYIDILVYNVSQFLFYN